jgi:hypothetical protein
MSPWPIINGKSLMLMNFMSIIKMAAYRMLMPKSDRPETTLSATCSKPISTGAAEGGVTAVQEADQERK